MSRFTKPSDAAEAASGEWFKPADNLNKLVLFKPQEHAKDLPNPFHDPTDEKSKPTRDAVRGDVIVIDEKGTDHVAYTGQQFVQASLIGILKGALGSMVLGRLVQVKSGPTKKYVLSDPTPSDEAAAERYLVLSDEPPF